MLVELSKSKLKTKTTTRLLDRLSWRDQSSSDESEAKLINKQHHSGEIESKLIAYMSM